MRRRSPAKSGSVSLQLHLDLALAVVLDDDEGNEAVALGVEVGGDRAQRAGIAHVDAQRLLHLQRSFLQRLQRLDAQADAFRALFRLHGR